MPSNKSALARYSIIHECLSSRRQKYWTTEDLLQAFLRNGMKISDRTLRDDIYSMKNDELLQYYAPIANCRKNKGYYYTVTDFTIRKLNFTDRQLKSFDFVNRQLLKYVDLDVMQEFSGAIEKVAGVFSQLRNKDLAACIIYEKAPSYEGLQYRDELLNAILNKEIIKIKYTTFKRSKGHTHVIEPHLLKEYKNFWYLVGLQHHRKQPIVLALDRINSITKLEKEYTNTTNFEAPRYFDNIIGVTITNGPVEKVVLQVTKPISDYIKKVPMHTSQSITEENEDHVIVQLHVKDNYELQSTILSQGSSVKVLEPLSLQNEIKQILVDTLRRYQVD